MFNNYYYKSISLLIGQIKTINLSVYNQYIKYTGNYSIFID